MNELIAKAIRAAIDDWKREAEGSVASADRYEREAEEHQLDADNARRIAGEHRADAARAQQAARDLTEALAAYEATSGKAP